MPDVLGDIYEGILGVCIAGMHGWTPQLAAPRPLPTCRSACEWSKKCQQLGYAPSLDVDPDLLAKSITGQELVAFVTHWRTTGFEKKFWRTAEEIFEYLTHKPEMYGLNYVAEPISQSENLRVCLGKLAGNSIDLPARWNENLNEAVQHIEREILPNLQPTSPNKTFDFFLEHRKQNNLKEYIDTVDEELCKSFPFGTTSINHRILRQKCIEARNQSKNWNIKDVNVHLRTSTQLLSLCLYALKKTGVTLKSDDFVKGMIRLEKKTLTTLHQLAQVPYRISGTRCKFFIRITKSILGETLYFEQEAFPDSVRDDSTLELAQTYLNFLENHPIWSTYLRRLCLEDINEWGESATIEPTAIHSIIKDVIINKVAPWRLDLLLNAAGLSRVAIGALLEESFQKQFGCSVRRLAPFGDEAKNVVAYCVRGESHLLKSLNDMSHQATLNLLSDLCSSILENKIKKPLELQSSLLTMQTKDIRTYLSGAPHPINGALEVMIRDLGVGSELDVRVATIFTQWFGGNTGRTIYQFRLIRGDAELHIKVSTGQDGNEGHKWKEVAARLRAHRLASELAVEAWLILDGTWGHAAVKKLYEAGYSRIFSVSDIKLIENSIKDWCSA